MWEVWTCTYGAALCGSAVAHWPDYRALAQSTSAPLASQWTQPSRDPSLGSNFSILLSWDHATLSSSQIPRCCEGEVRPKICWALFFNEARRNENSTCTTAKTKQSSDPAPTTTNGWTSCSTTRTFTLSILAGRRCVPAWLGIPFQSCSENFYYSEWTEKASAGLSRELSMMTAWFNIVKEQLARIRMRPMPTLRLSRRKRVRRYLGNIEER